MAKITEGDNRWIVKELGEQGRNVNSWHWEDKNVFHWAKERLTNIFKELTILSNDKMKLIIKSLHNIKGEAILTNRKG